MGDPVSDTTPPAGGQPPVPDPPSDPLAVPPYQQPAEPLPPAQTEYLEAGGGSPIDPDAKPVVSGGGGKRALLIGATVAVLAVVGVGAWAVVSFLATGAQPDEALPGTTIGYASIDLDPSGAQKIEALKTLNKFPAFKDELGLDTDDDIRQRIFEEIEKQADCGLDYANDIEPWLGDRMAVAAVDTGGDTPAPVVVVQVKDTDKADTGLAKLRDCTSSSGDSPATGGGWVFDGDWAIIAEDKETAQAVSDLTDKGTLADDPEYQDLTSAAGEIGIVNLYAAPEAGQHLADLMGGAGMGLGGMGLGGMGLEGLEGPLEGLTGIDGSDGSGSSSSSGSDSGAAPAAYVSADGETDPFADALKGFKGLAVAVRFDDGALEIESAGDLTGLGLSALYSSDRGADVMQTLPDDTALAMGAGFEPGWVTELAERAASFTGGEMTADDLMQEASKATGLDLPADIETLFGQSAALAVGSEFDVENLINSTDGSDLPIAAKVQGDPEAIKGVLAKIVEQAPSGESFLGTDSDGDTIVIGPNADYRGKVLAHGTLGDSDVFRDVVREADRAGAVFFINFNVNDDWLASAVGEEDKSIEENLKPLAGFGVTAWMDGDFAHSVLRLTTD
jgi:hypothetical protein